jgi:hypothetical protein
MQFSLRTLLILLAVVPPLSGYGYIRWQRYEEGRELMKLYREGFAAEDDRPRRTGH